MAEITIPLLSGIEQLGPLFSGVLNRVLVAAIILLVGFIAGRITGKFVQHVLHGMDLNKVVSLATGVKISFEEIGGRAVTYALYFIAAVAALDYLGLNTIVFSLLSAGVIAILTISFLLAMRDMIPNFVAGIVIHQKNLLKPGDTVKISRTEGNVVKVELLETHLRTKKGDDIFVPNATVIKKEILRKKR